MSGPARHRDPARKERILAAAAELVARRGFHAVSMAEIGAAAGIVGSGIYRHFDSKVAILAALLDRVMERLLRNATRLVQELPGDRSALAALISDQIVFVIDDRRLVQVYQREIHNLPDEDRRRLRRKQRHYIEEWVHVVVGLRPDLSDVEARTAVHAAIGAIQSVAYFHSGLPRERLVVLLADAAHACLGLPASPPSRSELSSAPGA
ncbi:MAG: TetR family transcriptional regulator [Pseudonocardiaceae bacterium]|nr:TetR family transcriptional regulator [Pseudonocardiaceae bacterium]